MIEIKTAIVDVQELIGNIDRKVRLAPQIAKQRGWQPAAVSTWLIVAEGSTNRRHVASHAAVLAAAFPDDGRKVRQWLQQPVGTVRALSFFSNDDATIVRRSVVTAKRVRRPSAAVTRA